MYGNGLHFVVDRYNSGLQHLSDGVNEMTSLANGLSKDCFIYFGRCGLGQSIRWIRFGVQGGYYFFCWSMEYLAGKIFISFKYFTFLLCNTNTCFFHLLQSWALAYFGTAISWRSKAQMKEGLQKFFDNLTPD